MGITEPSRTASRTTGVPDERLVDRSIRVFVSSTFRDMQGERDMLERTTFPALQSRFRERGVELLCVDLRWGVPPDAEKDVTIDLCLAEVNRCRPWFIGLLGERYGEVLKGAPVDQSVGECLSRVA